MTEAPNRRPAPGLARRAVRRGRKLAKRGQAYLAVAYLRLRNRLSRSPVTGTAPVTVSLTTYGPRLQTVATAIESIARGAERPQRLVLWLDASDLQASRPAALRRLERRGLEVRLSPNFGPHTKYHPFVQSRTDHDRPLVTADDDIIYPANWLSLLTAAGRRHPDAINAHWVSVMGASGDRMAAYATWERARDTAARPGNFALGVSGVLYPPAMLAELQRRGDGFLTSCPTADDIWLNWAALRAGIPVRQVRAAPHHFPIIPGSQATALATQNVGQNRNDDWIRGLYTADDMAALGALRPVTN